MNLVRIETAVAAIVAGEATVADVVAAARKARISSWDDFGGWSDEQGRSRKPSADEIAAFSAVRDALHAPSTPITDAQLDAICSARHATEAEQSLLDKAL